SDLVLLRERRLDAQRDVALERLRDRAAVLRGLGGFFEGGGVDAGDGAAHLERARDHAPAGLELLERHGGGYFQSRRRVAGAAETGGERHRVAARVRRGHQLLGAGLAVGGFGARRPAHGLILERAALRADLAVSLGQVAFPHYVRLPDRRHDRLQEFLLASACRRTGRSRAAPPRSRSASRPRSTRRSICPAAAAPARSARGAPRARPAPPPPTSARPTRW